MPGISHTLGIPFRRGGGGVAPIAANIVATSVEDATPTEVNLFFAWNLDDTSVPDTSAFALAGKTISDVAISGATVTVTVTVAYAYGDVITIDYTIPGSNPLLQESTGAEIMSFVDEPVTNYVHTPEVSTYITGLVTPLSVGQLALLNTFVVSLKTGLGITNLSDVFDIMYIFAGETEESSLKNLAKNFHHATAVNAPIFTALEGLAGDAISKCINTNYNPNTQGFRFSLNSASFGFYSRTNRAAHTTKIHGCSEGTSNVVIIPFRTAGVAKVYMNGSNTDVDVANSQGLFSSLRSSATTDHGARNKTITNGVRPSIAVPSYNIYFLADNDDGVLLYHDDIQLSFGYAGKNLLQADLNVLYDSFQAYMTANGKQV